METADVKGNFLAGNKKTETGNSISYKKETSHDRKQKRLHCKSFP